MISCDTYNLGCQVGDPYYSFLYLMQSKGGPVLDSEYPYASVDGPVPAPACNDTDLTSSHLLVEPGATQLADDIYSLKYALTEGPVLVGITVDEDFYSYSSGVYVGYYCSYLEHIGHYMVAVGYGYEWGEYYILFKNSWGTNWGESGYFRKRQNNYCRMLEYMWQPNVGFSYTV